MRCFGNARPGLLKSPTNKYIEGCVILKEAKDLAAAIGTTAAFLR
jgi:hypothetical protein